ncbi:Anaphase-promoting complex subunit 10 [Glycine soja]
MNFFRIWNFLRFSKGFCELANEGSNTETLPPVELLMFENLLSKKSRRKPYTAVGTVGRRKPYTALGTVVGAQSSKLSTLPVNKLIVLYVVFKLHESYTPNKVSIRAGDGFHNLKEIKTVELVKPTGWVYLSLSGAYPR